MTRYLAPVLLPLAAAPATLAQSPFPHDSALRAIVAERVESGRAVGLVLGLVDRADHRRIVSYGSSGGARPLDGSTVFEIGSITKVFTTIALADMARAGEVQLDDPVANYVPESVTVPSRDGKPITLAMLATQTSGLPRLPANMAPADQANPYADYTVEQLYAFLSSYTLPRDPGSQYEYSNLGMGLLGHALARRAATSFEDLVAARITTPLGMRDTRITLTADLRDRLATGHDATGRPVANWDIPTLAGAGALRSTVDDMLTFLQANLDSTSVLWPAASATHGARVETGVENLAVGLGWHIFTRPTGRIVWHNGGTGGYHSFAGFDPERGMGVVVLANSSHDIDDIGVHLLDPSSPLKQAPSEVAVDPMVLEAYVGEYTVSPAFALTITRQGTRLFVQGTGQPAFRLYAESQTEFVVPEVGARITFEPDSAGTVNRLMLRQAGQEIPAARVQKP
jgi:CubicO group peptidase (beta-lactamase class C family)